MKYSKEVKDKVITEYNQDIKASTISKNTNISKATIYKWVNENKQNSPLPVSHREIQKLIRKVQRLETIIEIIHKTHISSKRPL